MVCRWQVPIWNRSRQRERENERDSSREEEDERDSESERENSNDSKSVRERRKYEMRKRMDVSGSDGQILRD